MTPEEKVAHLEGWIKTLVDYTDKPVTGNHIIDRARMHSVNQCLRQATQYAPVEPRVIRWLV